MKKHTLTATPALPLTDLAVVVIDMQRRFCDALPEEIERQLRADYDARESQYWKDIPSLQKAFMRAKWQHQHNHTHPGTLQTQALAERLPAILDGIRAARIPVVQVYTHESELPCEAIDFTAPAAAGDTVIHKKGDSALQGGAFRAQVAAKTLVFCGVNLNACVRASAVDAVKAGYNVYIVGDLCANGRSITTQAPNIIRTLKKHGVTFISAEDLMAQIKSAPMATMKHAAPPAPL